MLVTVGGSFYNPTVVGHRTKVDGQAEGARSVSEATPIRDRAKLAAATANRLRLVQTDFADESEQVRRDYLADEIQRALSSIVPSERQEFLEELSSRFPTWDAQVDLGGSRQHASVVQTPTDQKELQDPSFLVSRLIELSPKLSQQQKDALVHKLREAGLAPAAVVEWPEQPAQMARTKLQAGPRDPLDPGRVLELLSLEAEFTASLDQLVWTTWRTVAPRSQIRRPQGLLKNMARFASGDPDVARGQVTMDLDKLRQLVAAIISAISQAGRQFAHNHAVKFSPQEIEALAAMERGGMLVSKEVKCWRKYVELAAGRDEASIESEIMQAIADYAESLMKGLGR
jgi:hypothetical protein